MDVSLLRSVVLLLGGFGITSVAGVTLIAVSGNEGHAALIALTALSGGITTSLGALVGLLVNPNTRSQPAQTQNPAPTGVTKP